MEGREKEKGIEKTREEQEEKRKGAYHSLSSFGRYAPVSCSVFPTGEGDGA
jgi:hypothetical protein